MKRILILAFALVVAMAAGVEAIDGIDGDSHAVFGSISSAITAITGDPITMFAVSGSTSIDVLGRISGDFTGGTFNRFFIIVGTNDASWRFSSSGSYTTDSAMIAIYSNNLRAIIDTIKIHGAIPYLICPPPRWNNTDEHQKKNYLTKLLVAAMRDVCFQKQTRFCEHFPYTAKLTSTNYQIDNIADLYAADDLHEEPAGYAIIGAKVPASDISFQGVMTGKTNGYPWSSCALSGTATITGNADTGTLSLPAIGDACQGFVVACGNSVTNSLAYTVAIGSSDSSKCDVYMRAHSYNWPRNYTSIPWIKTNALYVKHCPFIQWKIVCRTSGASIPKVNLNYQIISDSQLLASEKFKQTITANGSLISATESRRHLLLSLDSVFANGKRSNGRDFLITDSTNQLVDYKLVTFDTTKNLCQILVPISFVRSLSSKLVIYWGSGYALTSGYALDTSICGYYAMVNDPSQGLFDQSYMCKLSAPSGSWLATDTLGGGIKFDGTVKYFNATSGIFSPVPSYTILARFRVANTADGNNHLVFAGSFDLNYCLFTSGAKIYAKTGNGTYIISTTNISSNTWYDVALTCDTSNKNGKLYVNGIYDNQVGSPGIGSVEGNNAIGYELSRGWTMQSNDIISHLSYYQEVLSDSLIKTWHANTNNPATFFSVGVIQPASSGGNGELVGGVIASALLLGGIGIGKLARRFKKV